MATRRRKKEDGDANVAIDEVIAEAIAKLKSPSNAQRKRSMRVTALAAAAVAQAAKESPLSEEKLRQLKTRLQYRLYQRNHRAKNQRKADDLNGQVSSLHTQIAELADAKSTLAIGMAQRTIDKLMATFCSGTTGTSTSGSSISGSSVSGSGNSGSSKQGSGDPTAENRLLGLLVDDNTFQQWMVTQWTALKNGFNHWELSTTDEPLLMSVDDPNVLVLASFPVLLTLRGSASQFAALLANTDGHDTMRIATILSASQSFTIRGRCLCGIARSGLVASMTLDFDLVMALVEALKRPLAEIAHVVAGVRFPFLNVDPLPSPEDVDDPSRHQQPRSPVDGSDSDSTADQRLSMTFLLG